MMMGLYDWLRLTEIVIAFIGIMVWVRVYRVRPRPQRYAAAGPILAFILLIVYNLIRLCGIEIELTHGSLSHAIRIMLLIVITGGGYLKR